LRLILNQKANKVVTFILVYTETTRKQTYSIKYRVSTLTKLIPILYFLS